LRSIKINPVGAMSHSNFNRNVSYAKNAFRFLFLTQINMSGRGLSQNLIKRRAVRPRRQFGFHGQLDEELQGGG
jgi:hypothetical protein